MPKLPTPTLPDALPDLHATRQAIRSGQTTSAEQMQRALEIAASKTCASTFRQLNPLALRQAEQTSPETTLAGLAVSVKDLFDIAGEVTASGTTVMASNPPATQDALAVARLKAAGGVVIGRTHMVELAFSGIGVNPHFGTPANPEALLADPSTPRIPGGSSSGAAVSVASGAAFMGLGSDTGGSIRIPAALCGLVGFKPTARSVSLQGAVPLSHTLDSIGALTRSVRDAVLAHEILSGQSIASTGKALGDCHFAVAQTLMQDGLDTQVAAQFDQSLSQLSQAGAKITFIPLHQIADLGSIQSRGGFSAPEVQSWMVPAGLWPARRAELDPRVAQRIAMADSMSAADYVRLQLARKQWIAQTEQALQGFDGVLSPTVPLVAPPIADVAPAEGFDPAQDAQRDAEFFRINALMLRNTSVVNLLDGCAISLPNHRPGDLPTGLMLWHARGKDSQILQISLQMEALVQIKKRFLG
jgi:aspartyl-tRNA(Asn)/glutamyl-tRNA(Gln) amidotransferase subunit A